MSKPRKLTFPTPDKPHGAIVLNLWDADDPMCVINLVSNKLREAIIALPQFWYEMTEFDLKRKCDPNEFDKALRESFWIEYFLACDNSRQMRMDSVYGRFMNRVNFYVRVDDPRKLAWIIRPPIEYTYKMKSLLDTALMRIEEVLEKPIDSSNPREVANLIKITELLDNRVKGAVMQRLQIESRSVNVNTTIGPAKSFKDVTSELSAVQDEIKQLTNGGPVDVTGSVGAEAIITVEEEGAPASPAEEER